MKNPFIGLFRSRDKPRNAISAAETFHFGSSVSGKSVNPRNAVQVSTVYACVRVIAETIASLPLAVYEDRGICNISSKSLGSKKFSTLVPGCNV